MQVISKILQLQKLGMPDANMIRTPIAPANGEGPLRWRMVGEVDGIMEYNTLTGDSIPELGIPFPVCLA